MSYVLSPRAQADLDEIWDYTQAQWSTAQAERYIRGIQSAIEEIAKDPRRGRPCDEIRPGYRRAPVGSHIVFYRRSERGIDVVRILHQRMDFNSRL